MRPNKRNKRKANKPQKRKHSEKEMLDEHVEADEPATWDESEETTDELVRKSNTKRKLRVKFVHETPSIEDLTTESVEEEISKGKPSNGGPAIKSGKVHANGGKYEEDPDWVLKIMEDIKEDMNGNASGTSSLINAESGEQENKIVELRKSAINESNEELSETGKIVSICGSESEEKESDTNMLEESTRPCVIIKKEVLDEIEEADGNSMHSPLEEHQEETAKGRECSLCRPSVCLKTGVTLAMTPHSNEEDKNTNGLNLLAEVAELEDIRRKHVFLDQEDDKQKERGTPPADTIHAPEQTKMTNETEVAERHEGTENTQGGTSKIGMHSRRRLRKEKEAEEIVQLDNIIKERDDGSTTLTKRSKDLQSKGVTILQVEHALVLKKVPDRELERAKKKKMDILLNRRDKIMGRDSGSTTIFPGIIWEMGLKQDEPGKVLAPKRYEEIGVYEHLADVCASPKISSFLRLVSVGLMTIMREHPEFRYAVHGLNSCLAGRQVGKLHDAQIQSIADAIGLDLPLDVRHEVDQQGVYLGCSLINISVIGAYELSKLKCASP